MKYALVIVLLFVVVPLVCILLAAIGFDIEWHQTWTLVRPLFVVGGVAVVGWLLWWSASLVLPTRVRITRNVITLNCVGSETYRWDRITDAAIVAEDHPPGHLAFTYHPPHGAAVRGEVPLSSEVDQRALQQFLDDVMRAANSS